MPNVRRIFLCRWLLVAVIPLAVAGGAGCSRKGLSPGTDGGIGGGAGIPGTGGATTGVGGAAGMEAACAGASDPRLVVASQRIFPLTKNETLNTVRRLFGDVEAAALVGIIGTDGDNVDQQRRFPPLQELAITGSNFPQRDQIASHVGDYVRANFVSVTACATATDACANAYLDQLAGKAFRRQLAPDERTRFAALYNRLRAPQTVNGYDVTFTVEEATGYAVESLLSSPQMLWRWEIGDPTMASASPAGLPLTDQELATHLAFFLTDQPPDDALLAAANAGTLRATLASQVDRLLGSPTARDWLRTIMETYFGVNTVAAAPIDPAKFPIFTAVLAADMGVETRKFLDNTLWNGNLTDLLLSRTAFLNTSLATIYGVPIPAGATATNFVQTTLPSEQRSGLLTNAAFLTARSTRDGSGAVVPRGLAVATAVLCTAPDAYVHPAPSVTPIPAAQLTAQQQVAMRAAVPACKDCHARFDPYGLLLDNYDAVGRYRTNDDLGMPVDAHTMLPAAIGGDAVANGVELAQTLATKPAFTNCMARTLLQYAVVDLAARVDVPLAPQQAGCATADLVQRYQSADGKTFTDLVRATAASPAFVLRRAAP